MLFAAAGLLIGGIDDLMVDLIFLGHRMIRRKRARLSIATLPYPSDPQRLLIFLAAWDESAVIERMLFSALSRIDHANYRIYVGLYPNDHATIVAAGRVAERDPRIRLVINRKAGPTTKADNLNNIWHAALADERSEGIRIKAIVLHDAEDVIHPAELHAIEALIEGRAVVQLPVLPLVKQGSRLVSGHYADEFAEAHALLPQKRWSLSPIAA